MEAAEAHWAPTDPAAYVAPTAHVDYLCMSLAPIDAPSDAGPDLRSPWPVVHSGGATTFCRLPNCSVGPPPASTSARHIRVQRPVTPAGVELETAAGPLLSIPSTAGPDDALLAIDAWIARHRSSGDVVSASAQQFFHLYKIAATLHGDAPMVPNGSYIVIPIILLS